MSFEERYKNCALVPEDLTEELLAGLRGRLVTLYAPDHWPTESSRAARGCVRRVCKCYVAQASLSKGLTMRGQSHFTLAEEDEDKVCVNMNYHSRGILCDCVNIVLSGILDRRLEPASERGRLNCAFS